MLIDSHAHLDLPEFDGDRDLVVQRAVEKGVKYILNVGVNLESSRKATELADKYDIIFASVGVHPHDAKAIEDGTYTALKSLAKKRKVLAFGEIGLDFFRDLSAREVQVKRFREQINLAGELKLPLIIHDRDAHKEIVNILREEGAKNLGGVIHCFSGDYAMAKSCLDMGFSISIPGTVTFPKALQLQEIVKKLPLSSILIETDCPFLAPVPHRGKKNEPSFVRYVAEKIAFMKNTSFENVAKATSLNFKRLFAPFLLP